MFKKTLISLSVVLLLTFASCGGGSSKEAKALLQKILQLVGIPQHVTVNICQDENKNGLCENFELQASININSGDDIDTIWQKITKDKDGRYFLETYDETLPILLEVQDTANLDFDDSKFTLTFNGFETKEENETKELSILESMVDANVLSKDIADKFRTLDNAEAQDKYYTALFESLETNINTLRREDLNKEEAINATIKEMAEETKINQAQADRINSCENNQSCVDKEIKKVSDELIISDEEVTEITGREIKPTPIAGGEEVVYGKWVKPSRSVCEENGGNYHTYFESFDSGTKYKDLKYTDCGATWENAKNICSASGAILPNIETLGAVITDCGGDWVSYYNDDGDNRDERTDKNRANESYQACYRERGFSPVSYWSSTTKDTSDSSSSWFVYFGNGSDGGWHKHSNSDFALCVR